MTARRRQLLPQLRRLPLFQSRHAGPTVLVGGLLALVALWTGLRPAGFSAVYTAGEIAGVAAVYLMAGALLLASRIQWFEQWFGGLDGMYYWHKRLALAAVPLLLGHALLVELGSDGHLRRFVAARAGHVLGAVALVGLLGLTVVSLPRLSGLAHLSYRRWLPVHRLIGLFLVVALIHGWMLDPVLDAAPWLRVLYTVIGALGVAAYAYDELLRRRLEPRAEYTIKSVDRPSPGTLDVTLAPVVPQALRPEPGQFVYLRVACARPSREHPFSVAGTGPDGAVRLAIRALGPETRSFYSEVRDGMPVRLSGPYGMFDFSIGGERQLWVAGGIGIAPFLGWATDRADSLPRVDLFYSAPSAAEMPFLTELAKAARDNPSLTVHPHFSDGGRLTAEVIIASIDSLPPGTQAFLCGPAAMVKDIRRGLRSNGIARDHIHAEHLAFR